MVRTSKQSATPSTVAPVQNVVVSADAAAPAKKARKPKATAAAEPAPAPAVEVEAAPVPEVDASTELSSSNLKITEFGAKLQQLSSLFSSIKADFKLLEKSVVRDLKNAEKRSTKKGKRSGNRAPSGFVKPTRISDELATFLGKTVGTEMARTQVSKEINTYIRNNNLQDKTNGRKIVPDARLTQLLKITDADELTYFNLQKYMKHHFVKAAGVSATA